MIIPLQIKSGNKFIMGMLHMPICRTKGSPLVIMCNGLGGARADVNRIAVQAGRMAAKQGIMVFRFDYRGQGISEGEFWDVSLNRRVEDVLEIIQFFRGCLQDEVHKIVLLGLSDGAKVALQATEYTKDVVALVLWSPLLFNLIPESNQENDNISLSMTRLVRHPKSKKIVYPFQGLWMGSKYLKELKEEKSLTILNKTLIPKLCILAGNDEFIDNRMKQVIQQYVKDEKSLVMHIEAANHIFTKREWSNPLIELTIDWITELCEKTHKIKE